MGINRYFVSASYDSEDETGVLRVHHFLMELLFLRDRLFLREHPLLRACILLREPLFMRELFLIDLTQEIRLGIV